MTSRTGPMDLFPSQLGQPWDSVVSYEHEKNLWVRNDVQGLCQRHDFIETPAPLRFDPGV